MDPWETLGVSAEIDVADLRRRYAALIKQFRPETHPLDFARIREAYEVVLPHARRRADEVAEAAERAAVEADAALAVVLSEPASSAEEMPLSADSEAEAIDVPVIVAASPDGADAAGAEPDLGAHFRQFHALAESAQGTRDDALLPALRVLLQARARASLDDSQALEFALVRWFIEAESPALTLLFETGRAFDWHHHEARLSTWLSAWALRRMEALLALSRDLVYARHFSGNAWLRRLHAPHGRMGLIANRPATLDASAWAARWAHLCEDANAPALAAGLNDKALRSLRGRELLGTDLLLGALVAADLSGWIAGLLGLVAAAGAFALRRVLSVLRGVNRASPIGKAFDWADQNRKTLAGCLVALAVIGVLLATSAHDDETGLTLAGTVLLIPALLWGATATWYGVGYAERVVAEGFAWRAAVDRLELDRLVRSSPERDGGSPFGRRLGWVQRLKAIPAARRLERVEIAQRARPPRPHLLRYLKALRLRLQIGRKTTIGRWIWFGLWIVFAIARGLHAFGH